MGAEGIVGGREAHAGILVAGFDEGEDLGKHILQVCGFQLLDQFLGWALTLALLLPLSPLSASPRRLDHGRNQPENDGQTHSNSHVHSPFRCEGTIFGNP